MWTTLLRLVRRGRYTGLGGAAIEFVLGENPTRRNALERAWLVTSVRHANRNQPFGHQNKKPGQRPGLIPCLRPRVATGGASYDEPARAAALALLPS